MGAVLLREIQSYFQAITGFIFLGMFLLFAGIIFALSNLWPPGSSDFRTTLSFLNFIFLVAVPVLTMRLLSEESRQKTDQLLLTSPISLTAIVLGKYLAALALFLAALLVTTIFPAMVSTAGLVVASELLCAYIGVFLLGASLIAVGLFVSSLTDNQVSAALLTFGAILLIWVMDWVVQALPRDPVASFAFLVVASVLAAVFVFLTTRNLWVALAVGVLALAATFVSYLLWPGSFDGLLVHVVVWFSLVARYNNFSRGVLAVGPVLYYVSFAATFLFLTVRVIDRRRWA
jgi:ABC-2 type transport system permease protein